MKSVNTKRPKTFKEDLASRIRKAAKIIGGGNELSRRIGMSRTTLESYLKGVTEPQVSTLMDIALKAGVSLEWLLTGDEPKSVQLKKTPGFQEIHKEPNNDPFIQDPAVVALMASRRITSEMVEDAVRNLLEYLLERDNTLEPKSISKAAGILCEMGADEGRVDMETVKRLMAIKG
jgi:transcriptional regulator with XRE-family HTH domain